MPTIESQPPPTIESIRGQISSLVGNKDEGSDSNTQRPEPFEDRYERLAGAASPAVKEARKDLDPLVVEVRTAKSELEYKRYKKEKTPPHSEIAEIYEKSVLKARLEFDVALVRRAFEANGNVESIPGSDDLSELKLDYLVELDPQRIDDIDWDVFRSDEDKKPYIFFTEVKEKKGFFEKEPKNTGQVLVVMSMNNGDTQDENTVVTMLVRHKGGKLLWGSNNSGLYRVQSEREYRDMVLKEPKHDTADSLLAKGEVTVEKYNVFYKKAERKTLKEYWVDKDAELTKEPSDDDVRGGEKRTERTLTEAKRKEMLEGLSGEYTRRLQELRRVEDQIIELTQAKVTGIEARNKAIFEDEQFQNIIKLLRERDAKKNGNFIGILKKSVSKWHGIHAEDLNWLLGQVVGGGS